MFLVTVWNRALTRFLVSVTSLGLLCACPSRPPDDPAASAAAAAAASQPAASATTVTVDAAVLMKALFGSAVRPDGYALADLADPDEPKQRARFLVEPMLAATLPTGEVLLVANAEMVDEQGVSQSGHTSPGLLNVFVFARTPAGWKVHQRHENVAALGSSGQLGSVSLVDLGHGKSGLAIEHGGMWQGYSIGFLALVDVTGGQARLLTAGIKTRSSNEGACVEESLCWGVEGKVRYVPSARPGGYPDVELTFSGRLPPDEEPQVSDEAASAVESVDPAASQAAASAEADQAAARPAAKPGKAVGGRAVYRFDGKDYELVTGTNPVPDI